MGEHKNSANGAIGGASGGVKKQQEMKLVLIGREGVGKSCLMMQYISHSFDENHEPTLEDTSFTQRVVDGKPWALQIIDTAGQEEFQYLVEQYYQSGHGFLAVFDLCNKESLHELQTMFTRVARSKDLLDNSAEPIHPHIACVIVGNKVDLPADQFEVTQNDIDRFTRQFEFPFFETSAKTPLNVEEAFERLIRETSMKIFHSQPTPDSSGPQKKSRKEKGHHHHNGGRSGASNKCAIS